MKRMTSKEILAASFRELAEKKSFDKIKVKDITDNCGYSPATFYRQFKDKYDLIAWDYTQKTSEIMNKPTDDKQAWVKAIMEGAIRFQQEREYISNLILNTSGHDSFVQYMTDINYQLLRDFIVMRHPEATINEHENICIRVYCLGTVSLTCEWVLRKIRLSTKELAQVYEEALPQVLKKYLYE